jgi:hypothetical protein
LQHRPEGKPALGFRAKLQQKNGDKLPAETVAQIARASLREMSRALALLRKQLPTCPRPGANVLLDVRALRTIRGARARTRKVWAGISVLKRRKKPSTRAELKTSAGNVFQKHVNAKGKVSYTKNGKKSSERAFKSARRFAVERRDEETYRVDLSKPARTQGDIAYTDKRGRWHAGPDAKDYIPGLRKGALLDPDTLTELRTIRGRERNFVAFSFLRKNLKLEGAELEAKYYEFLDKIAKAKTAKQRTKILRAFGWSYWQTL